jgi:hypothetical protein
MDLQGKERAEDVVGDVGVAFVAPEGEVRVAHGDGVARLGVVLLHVASDVARAEPLTACEERSSAREIKRELSLIIM